MRQQCKDENCTINTSVLIRADRSRWLFWRTFTKNKTKKHWWWRETGRTVHLPVSFKFHTWQEVMRVVDSAPVWNRALRGCRLKKWLLFLFDKKQFGLRRVFCSRCAAEHKASWREGMWEIPGNVRKTGAHKPASFNGNFFFTLLLTRCS